PALMHSETASCQCESWRMEMAALMKVTILGAVTAAAALFVAQPVQAGTAAVQPHQIMFNHAPAIAVENVGRRGYGYRRGGYGYRHGFYRSGYYRPYRLFYGGGFPAYGYGYGNGYGYASDYGDDNGYGYANDYGYGNGYGYENDYGYANDYGDGNGYGYAN